MDKIYSRKRIKLPIIKAINMRKIRDNQYINDSKYDINNEKFKNKKIRKSIKIIVIFIIGVATANIMMDSVNPIIDRQCETIAKSIATKISNEEASKIMSRYKYEDLCNITKDANENITMISANVITVNEIISDVAVKIQGELNKTSNGTFNIRLGSFTGTKLLSGRGPNVEIRMSTIGNLDTELKSEFYSAGINQTFHKIYLDVKCNVVVLTPFNSLERQISNQVLLAEAIIVGTTPNTYYNLEGLNKDNLVEMTH